MDKFIKLNNDILKNIINTSKDSGIEIMLISYLRFRVGCDWKVHTCTNWILDDLNIKNNDRNRKKILDIINSQKNTYYFCDCKKETKSSDRITFTLSYDSYMPDKNFTIVTLEELNNIINAKGNIYKDKLLLTLLGIKVYYNEKKKYCYPSVDKIAKIIRMTKPTVLKHIEQLEEMKLIYVRKISIRFNKGTVKKINYYSFDKEFLTDNKIVSIVTNHFNNIKDITDNNVNAILYDNNLNKEKVTTKECKNDEEINYDYDYEDDDSWLKNFE